MKGVRCRDANLQFAASICCASRKLTRKLPRGKRASAYSTNSWHGRSFWQNEAKKLNRFKADQPGPSAFGVNLKVLQRRWPGAASGTKKGLGRDSNNHQFCRLTENRLAKSGFPQNSANPVYSENPSRFPV